MTTKALILMAVLILALSIEPASCAPELQEEHGLGSMKKQSPLFYPFVDGIPSEIAPGVYVVNPLPSLWQKTCHRMGPSETLKTKSKMTSLEELFGKDRCTIGLSNGRLTISGATDQEVEDCKEKLKSVKDGQIPKNLEGAVLIDGKVEKQLACDANGQSAWMVHVKHVYAGGEQIHTNPVKVMSPRLADGGIKLVVGKRYRIMAADWQQFLEHERGELFCWKVTVIELHLDFKK